ncbi:MAG: ABC transporter permease [Clostridiales bacterium]|nr:ABC transporter permease [Clostridiales bacterium]
MTIYRWELQRIFSNWRKTATLFLLPAVILTIALNIFPLLMNYLSTGSFVSRPIIIVDAPDSFKQYLDENIDANVFSYEFWSYNRLNQVTKDEGIHQVVKNGTVICSFWSGEKNTDFDKKIAEYYGEIYSGEHVESNAVVYVAYSASSIGGQALAEQFKQNVLDKYQNDLITILGGEYSLIGSDLFYIDSFNPVTRFMDFRISANSSASRVIPGILMIMMYYCVYSLAEDMFAQEKSRGFLTKLFMTPVPASHFIIGKTLAIVYIASVSTYITTFVMFFASWINRSNSAMSLLPFGLFLTPTQLLIIAIAVPVTCFLMCAVCLSIIFALDRLQDTIVNLQLPLLLFLADFFIQMFRATRPMTIEYFIPIHNALTVMSETFNSQEKFWHVAVLALLNSAIALLIYRRIIRRQGFESNKRK